MFAQLGIPTYGIRACAKVRDNKEMLSRTVHELLFINLVMSFFAYGVFGICLLTVPKLRMEKTLFLIMSTTIFFNVIGVEWLYKGLEQYTYITVRSLVFKVIALFVTLCLVRKKSDYVIYGALTIMAASASNILNFINAHKYIQIKPVGNYHVGRHIRSVLIFFAMSCATVIYTNLDTVMLGFMKSDIDVGYYNAAVKIKTVLLGVVTSLGAVLLPRASYYIEHGMGKNWKWLAKLFAFFGVCVGLFGIGTFSQVNGISSAINGFFDPDNAHCVKILPFLGEYSWSVVIASLILTVCVAAVLIGGVKRIASVSQIIVPFMAILYFAFAVILIICNITEIPAAIKVIVTAAFTPKAVTGGAVGSMFVAMQKGVARGIFSNEAGLGSAPIAAAAAQTKEPVRQGLVSMTGTFIDTIVICTLTGLSIVLTGAWQVEGLEGVEVTTYAFQQGLPFPPAVSSFVLMLCLVFFAFTTILGWDYYSERCLEYLSGGNLKHVKVYRWIYIFAVFIGPYMTVSAVWTIADIFNGLMALPNMIALFALSGVVVKETKAFFKKQS